MPTMSASFGPTVMVSFSSHFGSTAVSPEVARGTLTAGRSSAKELASIQLEGVGPVPAIMGFLHQLGSLGYPLVVDAVQLTPETKPGSLKMNLTIVILDFEQFKTEEAPRA